MIRSHTSNEERIQALRTEGVSEEVIEQLMHTLGFRAFSLKNNNANIQRIKKRIEELKAIRTRQNIEIKKEAYTYKEDIHENRVMFCFDGKPDQEVRSILKRQGFKWSPTRGAWVRQLNGNGLYAAKEVIRILSTR